MTFRRTEFLVTLESRLKELRLISIQLAEHGKKPSPRSRLIRSVTLLLQPITYLLLYTKPDQRDSY